VHLLGPAGSGKTMLIDAFVRNAQRNDQQFVIRTPLNGCIDAAQVQHRIVGQLKRVQRTTLAAKGNKDCVLFVDDLNMGDLDEFFRSLVEYQAVYHKESTNEVLLLKILNTTLVSASN
jgi:Ni2+-binding GTPase involved in maturation of urease and hydrogenase